MQEPRHAAVGTVEEGSENVQNGRYHHQARGSIEAVASVKHQGAAGSSNENLMAKSKTQVSTEVREAEKSKADAKYAEQKAREKK